jgi:cytokinin dehydrogenase
MSDEILASELKSVLSGDVFTDTDHLEAVSTDFGRMITRLPRVLVRPASAEDVAATIRIAIKHQIPVTPRSAAHSQSGQALSQNGILIDMTSLSQDFQINPDEKNCVVDAGMLWSALVERLKPYKLIPPVLTNNLNVTVGGTLSMAGLGVASFRYGAQGDNCLELQVVTGAGEIQDCSLERNPDLFYHSLCGLGQFAIITKAKLRLRPHKSHVRLFFLLYDDLKTIMQDQRLLIEDQRMDTIESWCTPLPMGFRNLMGTIQTFGEWFFPMQLGFESEVGDVPPNSEQCLQGLNFYRHSHTEDVEFHDFANRLENLFNIWKRMGYWNNAHPWMETLLPWNSAETYMRQVLKNLPPASLGGGHILLWPSSGRTSKLPLFMRPDSDFIMGFGILPGVPKELLPIAVPRLNMASELSEAMGGKRYLSGLIQFEKNHWREHFGSRWETMKQMKRLCDPHNILNPGFIDFSI